MSHVVHELFQCKIVYKTKIYILNLSSVSIRYESEIEREKTIGWFGNWSNSKWFWIVLRAAIFEIHRFFLLIYACWVRLSRTIIELWSILMNEMSTQQHEHILYALFHINWLLDVTTSSELPLKWISYEYVSGSNTKTAKDEINHHIYIKWNKILRSTAYVKRWN